MAIYRAGHMQYQIFSTVCFDMFELSQFHDDKGRTKLNASMLGRAYKPTFFLSCKGTAFLLTNARCRLNPFQLNITANKQTEQYL